MNANPDNVVSAFDAKTHLSRLLQEVEQGQSITITKRGRPVARLVPIESAQPMDTKTLLDRFKAIRDSVKGKVDVIALRDAGRKY